MSEVAGVGLQNGAAKVTIAGVDDIFTVSVQTSATLFDIKNAIAQKKGIPKACQLLLSPTYDGGDTPLAENVQLDSIECAENGEKLLYLLVECFERVKVCVRVRPLSAREVSTGDENVVKVDKAANTVLIGDKSANQTHEFNFGG
jgi:hypothetical protein